MPHPCRTLEDVLVRLAAIEEAGLRAGDRQARFATLYAVMTEEIRQRLEAGFFEDNAWVRRFAVAFANLYFEAYDAAGAGRADGTPKAWRLYFDALASGRTILLQDLLLGVNAHINHDLAWALVGIGIDPDRERRARDHRAVNRVLAGITQRATDRLATAYAPGLRTLDAVGGELDEIVGQFSIEVARDNAWEGAVALTNARTEAERRLVGTMIGSRAALMARLLRSGSLSPTFVAVFRRLEEGDVMRGLLAV